MLYIWWGFEGNAQLVIDLNNYKVAQLKVANNEKYAKSVKRNGVILYQNARMFF